MLWDSVRRTDVALVQWWKNKTEPKLRRLLAQNPEAKLKSFHEDNIARLDAEKWYIAVLSYAIRNCLLLPDAKYKHLRESARQLTEIRNFLFHQSRSQISFDKYVLSILRTPIEHYKMLLSADKEACVKYVKQVESMRINNCENTQQKWDSYFNHDVVISVAGLLPIPRTLSYTSPTLHLYSYTDLYFSPHCMCFTSPTLSLLLL